VTIDQRANFQMNDEQMTLRQLKQLSEALNNELSNPQYTVNANCYNCGVDSTVSSAMPLLTFTVESTPQL
jgi:hypothetical protein